MCFVAGIYFIRKTGKKYIRNSDSSTGGAVTLLGFSSPRQYSSPREKFPFSFRILLTDLSGNSADTFCNSEDSVTQLSNVLRLTRQAYSARLVKAFDASNSQAGFSHPFPYLKCPPFPAPKPNHPPPYSVMKATDCPLFGTVNSRSPSGAQIWYFQRDKIATQSTYGEVLSTTVR